MRSGVWLLFLLAAGLSACRAPLGPGTGVPVGALPPAAPPTDVHSPLAAAVRELQAAVAPAPDPTRPLPSSVARRGGRAGVSAPSRPAAATRWLGVVAFVLLAGGTFLLLRRRRGRGSGDRDRFDPDEAWAVFQMQLDRRARRRRRDAPPRWSASS